MTTTIAQERIELVCTPAAISQEDREAHMANGQQLLSQACLEKKELPDGYAFKFAANQFENITQFIANERLCCAFFTFELKIAPNQDPIWLHIRGNEQIKTFLQTELQAGGN